MTAIVLATSSAWSQVFDSPSSGPPEQPEWTTTGTPTTDPPLSSGRSSSGISPTPIVSEDLGPAVDMTKPDVHSSTTTEDPQSDLGVPKKDNFFLPDFDDYGRPFFERQGLRFRAGPLNLRMSLTVGVEYNDNIYGSSTDKIADSIAHVAPTFLLGIGDFSAKTEDFLTLNYHPSIDYYQTQKQQNHVNQNLDITGQATFSRYSTKGNLSYQSSNLPNATQTGGQNYTNLAFDWDNRYYIGAKTFARAQVSAIIQTSENNNNYQTFSISPQIGYTYSPKTTIFLGPFAGIANIDNGGSQTFQGLSAGINYSNLRKLQFSGSFGVQARQFDTQNTTGASNFITPVFNFGLAYAVGPNTNATLGLLRDVQLSDVQRGLTYTNSQLSLSLTQRLFNRISFNLGLAYQLLEYQGDAPIGRTDQYISVTPSLSYSFWKDTFNVSVFYRRQNRSSDIETFSYDVTAYGINLTYKF